MPEQTSHRAQPVTTAPITQPFETSIYPCGLGGLNLKDQKDQIPVGQFAVHTNLTHTMDRGVTGRPGLTTVATGGTNHHSVRRLHDPHAGVDTALWGTDQDLRRGLSGALAVIDTGYSGDPLSLLPHRPPLSGAPWMFVADRTRMRKIRADGLVLPIGLPAPGAAPTAVLGTRHSKVICAFDALDPSGPSDATQWEPTAGFDRSDPSIATNVPLVQDAGGEDGNAMAFTTDPGGAATAYNSWWGIHRNLDLTTFDDAVLTGDDDLIHLWMNMSHPHLTEEMRIYLVVSGTFNGTVLPGTSATENVDYYVKTFRQNDFSQAIQGREAFVDAAETARVRKVRDEALADLSADFHTPQVGRVGVTDPSTRAIVDANQDPGRLVSSQAGAGAEEWVEYGVVDVPLRRGDFKRGGQTVGRDWSTVTGIIIYISVAQIGGPVAVRLDDLHIEGGEGLDSSEPGSQPYDWRYTHYDPRTGAEGNPSPEMAEADRLDCLRRQVDVQPAVYGDGSVRQRFYRRGGSLIADWYFTGENTSDGGLFTDTESDDGIVDAGTVNLDHYQPVPTVDDAGATVLAQPVPILFGPANGLLFALGDPYRPGHLAWCIPDEPDHWPAESNLEVCPPSEELMAGLLFGPQPFCFSRERLYAIYPNLSGDTEVTVTTTACRRGLVSRWAFAVGMGGIFGVAKDGIFVTTGGVEEILSIDIQPLFRNQTWNGYPPVDFTFPAAIRLTVHQDQLFFLYQGTDGNRHVLVYALLFKFWTAYDFAPSLSYLLSDSDTPITLLAAGGTATGKSYEVTPAAFSDDGVAITATIRTGTWNLGRPREDKLLGDQIIDADTQGVDLRLTNRLNDETVVNGANALVAAAGRTRLILDGFGTTPQRARNLSTEITWTSATARPTLYFLGLATVPEPDQTINRVTIWDDLGHPDESYVTGITLDCDTGDAAIPLHFERDFAGTITSLSDQSVQTAGRRKVKFSWAAQPAHKVRIRPDADCAPWILYRADWIAVPEPPRIAGWDIHFEADGDQYYTGLDLYCTTEGAEKQIRVQVDGVTLTNPYTGEAFWRVTTVGRQWVHLTLPWGRGHVFHFTALDQNPGLLYKHKWYTIPEPSEQANWNSAFSPQGTLADKWFKAFLFEVDTFGQNKTVTIELDGVVVETFGVTTSGRKIVHHALSQQRLGRVLRVFPVDGNASRPYTILPIFDVEPYKLDRWETQETDHDLPGFQIPIAAQITLRSTLEVTLTLSTYINQLGTIVTDTYTIPSTEGVKDKRYVPFVARKGVLFKYLFTSDADFHLFEEESEVMVQPWNGGQPVLRHPFGNDDQDRTRNMVTASDAAARSGGGT